MIRYHGQRVVALILLVLFLTGLAPGPARAAEGDYDPANYKVTDIQVGKTFDLNGNLTYMYISIEGVNLRNAVVRIDTYESGPVTLTPYRTINEADLLKFEVNAAQAGTGTSFLGETLRVGTYSVNINEDEMPRLTEVTRKVELNAAPPEGQLTLKGTNLNQIGTPGLEAKYGIPGNYIDIQPTSAADTIAQADHLTGQLGLQNIVFARNIVDAGHVFPGQGTQDVSTEIRHTYKDQFRLYRTLDLDGIEMHPNRGGAGDTVYFRREVLNWYDVYFLRAVDGTEPFSTRNRGLNPTYQQDAEGSIDLLTVQVPNLSVGEYFVVLTNRVTQGNPQEKVNQEYILGEKFTIVDSSLKMNISGVEPKTAPASGAKTILYGQFFGSLNIPQFSPASSDITVTTSVSDPHPRLLSLAYGGGTYNGTIPIQSATRTITVYIGDRAEFLKTEREGQVVFDYVFARDLDKINILSPAISDSDPDPVKDVVVETVTILTEEGTGKQYIFKERAELKNAYTYTSNKVMPEISGVTPEKIQVTGPNPPYQIPEDRMVAIHGKDFMIHRYIDQNGNEVVRYPIIELGPELGLNKNQVRNLNEPANNPNLYIKVFDASGRELDGSTGQELGTKILVIIPGGTPINTLGKTFVRVTNPVRYSTSSGLTAEKQDLVEFVNPEPNRVPVITSVIPDVVTVSGGDTVVVQGSNFMPGLTVMIDGEVVKGVVRREDGKELTFRAPPGREGETQLQIMNPEGGMATHPFTYVITYTNPRINDFNPKSGNTGTLVIVKGENFLKPDPTATEDAILKLIGTRVLLEGIEVNDYNRNVATGRIELRDYSSPPGQPLLSIGTNPSGGNYLQVADYYAALILQETGSPSRFFTLDVTPGGKVLLSDGAGTTYELQLDSSGTGIEASQQGGGTVTVSVASDSITVGGRQLNFRTAYTTNADGNITGQRVRVLDRNTIHFIVPVLGADGYYDLTVINPDTKKDSRLDEKGFYYFRLPTSRPVITRINPNEGSTQGGYQIDIEGQEFDDQVQVYINGVAATARTVNPAGTVITVTVPPYPGDLRNQLGTDRLTVPVVLVNPDGGTASKADGFTYVVPSSHPRLSKIVPEKGTAAGGDVVEITGTDFRFFEPYDDINRNQIWDPEEPFNDVNGNGRWDSETDLANPATDWRDPQPLDHPFYNQYFASPVLPKVYFGGSLARIVEFSRGYIKVISPPGFGKVDVFVVNNDSGVSNRLPFTYEGSNPKIERIVPGEGRKQGREKVEVYGSGFRESDIQVWNNGSLAPVRMPLVRFGAVSNRDIPRDEENSGRIDNGAATVNLPGGLRVEYRAAGTLIITLEESGVIYEANLPYDDSRRFINMQNLIRRGGSEQYTGYELLQVEVKDRRLLVDRGYSPEVEWLRESQMVVNTPSYYTVGTVPVTLFNPDGGTASGTFIYKNPDSSPRIINITRDGVDPEETDINGETVRVLRMNYQGGSLVNILGEDFRENARVQIANILTIAPANINYTLPSKLTFTMPAVPESEVGKLHRVMVINEDGGVATSDQPPAGQTKIYLQFTKGESTPQVTAVTPELGPASGGTVVKIEGKDFRARMDGYSNPLSVYFGEMQVPAENVNVVDYKTVRVLSPTNTPGKREVRVENPDGEFSRPSGEFTYISTPRIIAVVDAADNTENTPIKVISIEGGQQIKIKGAGFMEGARVVFNPVVKETGENSGGKVIYRVTTRTVDGQSSSELQPFTLESGTEASEVRFIDAETLVIKTPPGKLDTKGIMIVNPDNGASGVFDDLTYGLPELTAPMNVVAEIIHDRYYNTDRAIKVHWTAVSGATEYEIFVVEEEQSEFLGSTALTSYVYSDLMPNTRYKFIVTAIGNFGSSPPSAESNQVKTGSQVGAPDLDGAPGDNTILERSGTLARVQLGSKDRETVPLTIDLTRGTLAGATEVVIAIPASVVSKAGARDIHVQGKDFALKFNPAIFRVSRITDNRDRSDAGVRFYIHPAAGNTGTGGNNLSPVYVLEASALVGTESWNLDYLASNLSLTLDYDQAKARLRRFNHISIHRFDAGTGGWVALTPGQNTVTNQAALNRLGQYTIIGGRR